jgi:NO-binding membrane sensor protein with MHYT domain
LGDLGGGFAVLEAVLLGVVVLGLGFPGGALTEIEVRISWAMAALGISVLTAVIVSLAAVSVSPKRSSINSVVADFLMSCCGVGIISNSFKKSRMESSGSPAGSVILTGFLTGFLF